MLDDLAKQLTSELPEALVRSRMSEMTRSMLESLAARGMEMSDYLRLTGQSAEEIVASMRPQAEDASPRTSRWRRLPTQKTSRSPTR